MHALYSFEKKECMLPESFVYSVKCVLCDENHGIYLGEISRPFAVRSNENLRCEGNQNAKSYTTTIQCHFDNQLNAADLNAIFFRSIRDMRNSDQ